MTYFLNAEDEESVFEYLKNNRCSDSTIKLPKDFDWKKFGSIVRQSEYEYHPHTCQPNKIPKELFEKIRKILFEEAYLCYESDEGCEYVLSRFVDLLHQYKICK